MSVILYHYWILVFILLARDALVRDVAFAACKAGSCSLLKGGASLIRTTSMRAVQYVVLRKRQPATIAAPPGGREGWTLIELTPDMIAAGESRKES